MLTPADYTKYIRVTSAFEFASLYPYEVQVSEGWLSALLGPRLTDYGTDDTLKALVVPFLVYAVWSAYVLEGGAIATNSGLVEKETDYSSPIDDRTRAAIASRYEGLAKGYAERIEKHLSESNACNTTRFGVRTTKVAVIAPTQKRRW